MNKNVLFNNLAWLQRVSPKYTLQKGDRFVVFSDMHIGDRSGLDEFAPNADLFKSVLQQYYEQHGYRVVLNGDIEELKRFRLGNIMAAWPQLYATFGRLATQQRLYKLVGNHDTELMSHRDVDFTTTLPGLTLVYNDDTLLIFHGHQASHLFTTYNDVLGFFLRYVMTPLGIKNLSVSHSSSRKFRIERRVYQYSSEHKLLSVIGHTHRPLFESLSKIDATKFRIEKLCREYTSGDDARRASIENELGVYKNELATATRRYKRNGYSSSLYNSDLLVPCVFNSGCTIGKRGMTAVEIDDGRIRLVHWFDSRRSSKHFELHDYSLQQLGDSPYYRSVLNSDSLQYIFNRINLLS